jgi:sec-independent protein translocase protein TatA
MGFSIQHLLLTLVIVLLIFGTKRLKNVGADLGDAINGFRKAVKDGEESQNTSSSVEKFINSESYTIEK